MAHRCSAQLLPAGPLRGLCMQRADRFEGIEAQSSSCLGMVQVGFGSGFKCNSAVWKAMRNIHDTEHAEWAHMKNGNLERCWNYVQVRC